MKKLKKQKKKKVEASISYETQKSKNSSSQKLMRSERKHASAISHNTSD
jgi:hypothetical protein